MADYTGLYQTMLAAYRLFEDEDDRLATVRGWVEVESAGDPWAMRYEPAFYERYVAGEGHRPTEAKARATSWGLLQVMGQVAREFGFRGRYLSELCAPITNLDIAGKVLRKRYDQIGTWDGALAAFNGGLGGNRRPPYRRQAYADSVREAARRFA